MKRKFLCLFALALVVTGAAMAAPCKNVKDVLPAPTGFSAWSTYDVGTGDTTINASWDELFGATKYSVSVTVHFADSSLDYEAD